jgi:hypothetical protein
MDFDYKKLSHMFALLVVLFAFFLIIIYPALSLMDAFPTVSVSEIEITESVLIFSSIITVMIFIITPLIWYLLVNGFNFKQILTAMKIKFERIDEAFLWGVISAIVMFLIVMALGYLLYYLGVDSENLSNIEDLAGNISIFSMVFIIVVQSISEEIFFRGFLLEKIESFAGSIIAIFTTAVLFGLAHMAYGKVYPVIMPMMMGIILGYVVIRTKNLYAAIIGHMLFNFAAFIFYLFSKSLGF